ncbi:NADP-dependent oxidoreductase [Alkalimarinus coralli]|uniref:NADP-dependent oxidoreductase n=1 Tax=Alkalimarinus coralli TaxID=2935863 RepID=UPI00202ADA6C|nr:NADP-dependent oxidoreductase [Alkalimarinus coralli]
MKSIEYTRFGEPEVLSLVERDTPEPKANEVRVKVTAAGLNPIDYKTRKGLGFVAGQIEPQFNDGVGWVPGYDVAGLVDAVGDDCSEWKVGDRVMGMIGFPLQGGGYAEYAVTTAELLCKAPDNIDLASAAGVPLAALTAWQALFEVGAVKEGDKVLIHAAAGGVGHFAVQFAKARGAYVIATASSRNHDFLHEIGVDEAIDYTKTDFVDACYGLDFVLDTMGGDVGHWSLGVLASGGQLVTVPTVTAEQIIKEGRKRGIKTAGLTVHPDQEGLAAIAELIETDDVSIHIDKRFPLVDAKKAHTELETGHVRGKLLLTM